MISELRACLCFASADSDHAAIVAAELARRGIAVTPLPFELVSLGDSVSNRLQGLGATFELVMLVISNTTPHHEWAVGEMGRLNALGWTPTLYIPVLTADYRIPSGVGALAVVMSSERSVSYGVGGLLRLLSTRSVDEAGG
jgi:hypothetical protein